MRKEYKTIREVVGPLMMVDGVSGVKYDELVEIEQQSGEIRHGKVLEVEGDKALVQLFESSQGLKIQTSRARFLGHGMQLAVSPDMLGRVFDGMGRPKDGGPEIIPEQKLDINGTPINPAARDYPAEFIQTGISAIDGLNTLVRGQKLPVFSGSGLPHAKLAAQIARQAKVRASGEGFAVVFAAIGITFEEADFFVSDFRRTGAIDRTVLFLNLANDPAVERIATPRMAITCAEYLAYELGMHVLVIMTDITNYAEALREVSAYARGKDAKELAVILGESALSSIDKMYARFAGEFESRYISQGYDTNRDIEQTLDLGWELLKLLPRSEMKRIRDEYLDRYWPVGDESEE